MKTKILLVASLLLLPLLAIGAGQKKSTSQEQASSKKASSQEQSTGPKTALELALDFDKGTQAAWTDFKEDGALDKSNSWYGIPVSGINVQRGGDGLIQGFILTIDPYATVTIKQIRSTVSKFCGLSESDWKATEFEFGTRNLYKASSSKCATASFDNYVSGKGVWSLTLSKIAY